MSEMGAEMGEILDKAEEGLAGTAATVAPAEAAVQAQVLLVEMAQAVEVEAAAQVYMLVMEQHMMCFLLLLEVVVLDYSAKAPLDWAAHQLRHLEIPEKVAHLEMMGLGCPGPMVPAGSEELGEEAVETDIDLPTSMDTKIINREGMDNAAQFALFGVRADLFLQPTQETFKLWSSN